MAKNFFDVNDKTLEPSEVHRKDSDELYETAFNDDQKKVLDNFEPGGGGGSDLSLEITATQEGGAVVLDKTWAEIARASNSFIYTEVESIKAVTHVLGTMHDDNSGRYVIWSSSPVGGASIAFTTDSPNGYPSASM